jgi:hypothetical protein
MAAIVREQRVVRRERGVRPFQPLVHEAELEVRVLVRGHQAHRSAQRLGRVLRPTEEGLGECKRAVRRSVARAEGPCSEKGLTCLLSALQTTQNHAEGHVRLGATSQFHSEPKRARGTNFLPAVLKGST